MVATAKLMNPIPQYQLIAHITLKVTLALQSLEGFFASVLERKSIDMRHEGRINSMGALLLIAVGIVELHPNGRFQGRTRGIDRVSKVSKE